MGRPTIRDVARQAGYSIATVSLVLNNKKVSIPQDTRDKIWAAAQALEYRPNQLAVGMVTKRTRVLGLIIPDNSNMFFADLSKAIEVAARRAGYGVLYGNTSNDPKRDLAYMQMFTDRQVDAIIFARSAPLLKGDGETGLKFIQNSAIPFVTVDRQLPGSDTPAVLLDHFKGGYMATRHLLDLGHTRIGCYTGPRDLVSSSERLEGYRAALDDAGIPYDPSLLFEGDYQLGREREAFRHLLNHKVSAVFAFNDVMASGLYREAREAGLSIPEDLSVVGFDNIPFCDILQPPLTTVSQPIDQMGACVVDVLVQLLEGEDTADVKRNYTYQPKLIVRKSTCKYSDRKCKP